MTIIGAEVEVETEAETKAEIEAEIEVQTGVQTSVERGPAIKVGREETEGTKRSGEKAVTCTWVDQKGNQQFQVQYLVVVFNHFPFLVVKDHGRIFWGGFVSNST